MISIALLGAGRIGQIHGRNIAASSRAKLAGIADPLPEGANALSKATGAPVRPAEELIADRAIDAVASLGGLLRWGATCRGRSDIARGRDGGPGGVACGSC